MNRAIRLALLRFFERVHPGAALALAGVLTFSPVHPVLASNLDTIGLTSLLAAHPELDGSGLTISQVEASTSSTSSVYQPDPSKAGLSSSIFHYYDSTSTYGGGGSSFDAAKESSHANSVANAYYDVSAGVAPGVDTIEVFDASYFYSDIISRTVFSRGRNVWSPVAIASQIVNQSFVFNTTDSATIESVNLYYDAYANQYGTLFISGTQNGTGSVTYAPASMYNGISVGRVDGQHSGNVLIVAPGSATSFATPYVSGAAALLLQAANNGDGLALSGTDPTDSRLLKTLILNGATKTAGWSQTDTNPLDDTYGAGVLNVENSYTNLAAGQHAASSVTSVSSGTVAALSDLSGITPYTDLAGWDLKTVTASTTTDAATHYIFDLTADTPLTLTATITWNSITDVSAGTNWINDFNLYLIDLTTGNTLAQSISSTENVEHLYISNLVSGQYELQVILAGGTSVPTDTYALSYSFATVPEPASFSCFLLGLLFIVIVRRYRLHRRTH